MFEHVLLGDIVKYPKGNRIYKVTQIAGNAILLDNKYCDDVNTKLIILNKFRLHNEVLIGNNKLSKPVKIVDINFNGKEIIYSLENNEQYKESQLIKYNENQLQRKETPQSGGNDSGASRELCCRNKICFGTGHRSNKHSVNKSKERALKLYEQLPLGQQEVS